MIFVIPIILGVVALITAGVGVASGVDGMSKMEEANKIGNDAQKRYEKKRKSVQRNMKATQDLAKEYGQLQVQVQLLTIKRFIDSIEKNGQRASQSNKDFFEGFEGVSFQQIYEYKTALLNTLNDRAIDGLIELESKPFERERDAAKFQQIALLIKALAEIMKTPILDTAGNLNQTTAMLKTLYKNI
jgi:hypothetical protein